MARLSVEDLRVLVARGYESRGVEFKGSGKLSDKHFFAKVARAMIGMSNRRDGGTGIIGVDETPGRPTPVGVSSQALPTWKYDEVAATLANYTDPTVSFDLDVLSDGGMDFVVLDVHEFDEVPILCKKEYLKPASSGQPQKQILRPGACYVRSHHKPETSEIPGQEEMRAVLDLAIEKGVTRFITKAVKTGMLLPLTSPAGPTDAELYERQAEDLK